MPAESTRWLPGNGRLFELKDLADFAAWAYGAGGHDTTPIRVETNITLDASKLGIRKMWTGER